MGEVAHHIKFFTDSQAVIKALQQPFNRHRTLISAKKALEALERNNAVTVEWVPGHEGHRGNEVADRLAKRAAEQQGEAGEPLPAPPTHNKQKIQEWAKQRHEDRWRYTEHAKTIRWMMPEIDNKKLQDFINWPRADIRLFINTLTGQTGLNKLLFAAEVIESPLCHCGHGIEGSLHFLTQCERFARTRLETLGWGFLSPEELKDLEWTNVLKFIKRTGRFEFREDMAWTAPGIPAQGRPWDPGGEGSPPPSPGLPTQGRPWDPGGGGKTLEGHR